MKRFETLKTFRDRLPKLPRTWRIVRNLTLSAAVMLGIAALLGWPALSPDEAFRRMESACLLTPSRVVLKVDGAWGTAFLAEGDSWITVGDVRRYTSEPVNLKEYQATLNHVLPKKGLVVVMLPEKNEQDGAIAALWGAPEGAAGAVLELDLMGIEDPFHEHEVQGLETFTALGERQENGWFIFQFIPHDNHRGGQSCAMEMLMRMGALFRSEAETELPYRLTLVDAQGRTEAEQSGTLPPDQRIWHW